MTARRTNRSTFADHAVTMKTEGPLVDFATPEVELEEELVDALRNVLRTGAYIGGPLVDAFEQDFARFCEVKHCIALRSGKDALRFALKAAGVQQGESVITAANASVATVDAVSEIGAFPEFVDIDERTYNIDPGNVCRFLDTQCDTEELTGRPISRRSRRIISAILPIHMYGQPANMDPILEVAESYKLLVIEDASQAHGAEYFSRQSHRWMKAGSMGHAAAFSFDPGKNLGACGDAGAVTTNDSEIAEKVCTLRDRNQENDHPELGSCNSRLDAIQAGFLQAKLRHLTIWNSKRRRCAEIYRGLFSRAKQITTPFEPLWSRSVHEHYVIRVREREKLRQHLNDKGIATTIHHSVPLHLQNVYRELGYIEGDFPVNEKILREALALPMSPELTAAHQEFVAESVIACFKMPPESAVQLEFVRSTTGKL